MVDMIRTVKLANHVKQLDLMILTTRSKW